MNQRITLATLAQATEQQIFDQAVRGVIAQGRPSINAFGSCVYRSPDGLACAAGQLLSDEEASGLDGRDDSSWGGLVCDGAVPDIHMNLIYALQCCHDQAAQRATQLDGFVADFRDHAKNVAASFELDDSAACVSAH